MRMPFLSLPCTTHHNSVNGLGKFQDNTLKEASLLPNTANHNESAEHLGRWLSSCPTCPANTKLNKKRYYWPHIRSLKLLTTPPTASTLPTAICSTGRNNLEFNHKIYILNYYLSDKTYDNVWKLWEPPVYFFPKLNSKQLSPPATLNSLCDFIMGLSFQSRFSFLHKHSTLSLAPSMWIT